MSAERGRIYNTVCSVLRERFTRYEEETQRIMRITQGAVEEPST
jgi:hypothetical protein